MMESADGNVSADMVELYSALIAAWNTADASRFADLFTADRSLVGFDGNAIDGRGEIERRLGEIFAHHSTATYVSKIHSVHAFGESHVLLEAVAGMVPPGGSDINPDVNAVQCLTASRTGGRWRIEHYQNTPAAYHDRPAA